MRRMGKHRLASLDWENCVTSAFDAPHASNADELAVLALRQSLEGENQAIYDYQNWVNQLPEGHPVREGLVDIMREERAHVGELQQMLELMDLAESDDFEGGVEEVGAPRTGGRFIPYGSAHGKIVDDVMRRGGFDCTVHNLGSVEYDGPARDGELAIYGLEAPSIGYIDGWPVSLHFGLRCVSAVNIVDAVEQMNDKLRRGGMGGNYSIKLSGRNGGRVKRAQTVWNEYPVRLPRDRSQWDVNGSYADPQYDRAVNTEYSYVDGNGIRYTILEESQNGGEGRFDLSYRPSSSIDRSSYFANSFESAVETLERHTNEYIEASIRNNDPTYRGEQYLGSKAGSGRRRASQNAKKNGGMMNRKRRFAEFHGDITDVMANIERMIGQCDSIEEAKEVVDQELNGIGGEDLEPLYQDYGAEDFFSLVDAIAEKLWTGKAEARRKARAIRAAYRRNASRTAPAKRVKRAQEADAILWADDGRDGMEAELSDGRSVAAFETSDGDYCWELYFPNGDYEDGDRHYYSIEDAMSAVEKKYNLYRMASRRKRVRAMRSSGKRVRTAAPHIELSGGGKVYLSSTSDYDPDAAHVYFVESNGETHSDDVWNFGVNDLIGAVTEYVQQYVTLSDSDLDAIDQLVNNHYDNMFGAPGYGSYDKVFSNRKPVRAMRRRATGSPDEMGGGTNVVGPLKNDNSNLSDDLSLDAPLNDGADADNADYQPDKAREKAMEARRRRRAMRKRAASLAAESLAEDIVNDGPYADEGELYDAIMDAVESSLVYGYDVWRIAREYCSDGDIAELFETEYADDVYDEVYKHDMSELVQGGEGEVEARKRRARKAKKPTRQSFRKRAQEADDEREDTPEFVDETGDDEDEDDEEEPEAEEAPEPEDDDEEREARRAAVRKAMKAARGKVQKGARRVDEPEKNGPKMRQPVRVQKRSSSAAGVARKQAASYDDSCLFM